MANPTLTCGRILGFTWGAAVGICIGYDWEFSKDCDEVYDEDSIVVDSAPTRRKRTRINVQFLHTPPTDSDTPAAASVAERLDNGNAVNTPLGNLKLMAVKKSKGRDGVAVYDARFQCIGDTALPVTA